MQAQRLMFTRLLAALVIMLVLGSGLSQSVIESRIDGAFEGWTGSTIVKLVNGQVWQQAEYKYIYRYAYRPKVTIIATTRGYVMQVDGVRDAIRVTRVR